MIYMWQAHFTSASNTTLRFAYVVQEGDSSADLDYVSTTALSLNGGMSSASQRLSPGIPHKVYGHGCSSHAVLAGHFTSL